MGFRDIYGDITRAGASVAALSVESVDTLATFRARHRFPFSLLADADRAVTTEWNALNPKERGGIAYPSTWVIDSDLVIRYRALERTSSRVDPQPMLRFLRGEIEATAASTLRNVLPDIGASVRWTADLVGGFLRKKKPR